MAGMIPVFVPCGIAETQGPCDGRPGATMCSSSHRHGDSASGLEDWSLNTGIRTDEAAISVFADEESRFMMTRIDRNNG